MRNKLAKSIRRSYNKVKTLKPSRSVFDLSHEWLATCDMGKLYPFFWQEMSPGDTFHIANQMVVRAQPLLAPILHKVSMSTHYFFVPYRILWEEWEEFITGGTDGFSGGNNRSENLPDDFTPVLPRWSPSKNSIGSLWDYLGLPVDIVPNGALPLDFIRRCYNRIWNEYYRDENLQEEVSEDNEDILFRNWHKDYFTSALLGQQRGVSPSMPLTGSAPVVFSSGALFNIKDVNVTSASIVGTSSGSPGFSIVNIKFSVPVSSAFDNSSFTRVDVSSFKVSNIIGSVSVGSVRDSIGSVINGVANGEVNIVLNTNIGSSGDVNVEVFEASWIGDFTFADLSSVSAVDIKDLRVAFNIQKWLELANRGGVRYTEFLRSFFGVSPKDSRLQRPEYVGGTKAPLIVSEVLQTSSTDSEPTPQGNMAGHGIGASQTFAGSYTAVEYGMIMGLFSIMPETKYTQGINRQLLRRTKFDFLFPQFTHLSEQAIEGAEIYATDNETENRKVWGFNEVYDELRAVPSKIVGKMRDTFNYWHLGRIFDSKPSLNGDFIKCNPSKRIFAVPSEDGFIVNIANIVRAVRPLPKYGTPGGV